MEYKPFHQYYPKKAERETRSVSLSKPSKTYPSLPSGKYIFSESYCTALDDCKRVFLNVFYEGEDDSLKGKILATIGFGWDNIEHYENDWKDLIEDRIVTAAEMKGPNLEKGQYQSKYAKDLLKISKKYLVNKEDFVNRLERHSKMVDEKLSKK